jgi:hypothetical protein
VDIYDGPIFIGSRGSVPTGAVQCRSLSISWISVPYSKFREGWKDSSDLCEIRRDLHQSSG